MENTTQFDLNEAARQWRDKLSGSPVFRVDNLDELEAHLRSSVERLQATGLAVDEAFMVARHRVGDAAALEKEYGKVNAQTVWVTRATWLVAGLVVAPIVSQFLQLAVGLVGIIARWVGVGGEINKFVAMVTDWGIELGIICALWWLVTSNQPRLDGLAARRWKWPVLTATSLALVIMALTWLSIVLQSHNWFAHVTTSPFYRHIENIKGMEISFSVSPLTISQIVMMPFALVFMARHQFRSKPTA